MNSFRTVREAKEYLIRRILAQADRDGVPLSDVERNMLYFTETGWTLPNMMEISRDFDRNYDQDEYENKIGQIIRRINHEPDSDRDDWNRAVKRLRAEDHYLLVMIDGAFSVPAKRSRWDLVKLVLAGAIVIVVFLPILSFIHSHVADPTLARLIGQGALLALVVLVAYLANRGFRKSA